MREGASNTAAWRGHRRQWLKRNLNTRAGTVAFLGGLCLGTLLRLCWVLLLLWLASPTDPIHLQAEAFALGMSAMALAAFAAAGFFHPRTAYTPPPAVIAGVVLTGAFYMVALTTIADLLLH